MTDDRSKSRPADADDEARGPLGDSIPEHEDADPRAGGSLPQEKVKDRPSVGTVKPDDYPAQDRKDSSPVGAGRT